ncbi:hypothetical protein E3T61_07735 [Cryobacterium lactosi]|uniref:Asl1-like glycosyl hydrolase catalytic domain-containing protein n=1 Tax=Cryobacterium lactosi TaxID=1259202 RepID=A0A4R9BY25_9MICO|nr:glycosyl hydrolase [Cryobacterium lactosi]TFD91858.1 hypothetical protein E3T61_07735 [Cryobacterium lactosi]
MMTEKSATPRRPKVPSLKRRTWWIVGIAAALVVALGAVVIAQPWASTETARVDYPAKPVPAPVAAPAIEQLPASDDFDWWTPLTPSDSAEFLGSSTAQGGQSALEIRSAGPQSESDPPRLQQSISVERGGNYTLSFWAKGTDVGENAIQVRLGPSVGHTTFVSLPAGTYDWTQMSLDYVSPTDSAKMNIMVTAVGQAGSALVDSFVATGNGSAVAQIMNSDLESHSGQVALANKSLMLAQGEARLSVGSRQFPTGDITWSIVDELGAAVADGTQKLKDHYTSIDLTELPLGFYQLNLTAALESGPQDRSTTFGVIEPYEGVASSSAFGTHLHFHGGEKRIDNLIGTLADIGVGHVRADVGWWATESAPGVYDYEAVIENAMEEYAKAGIEALQLPVYSNPLYDDGLTPSTPEGLQAYANFTNDLLNKFPNVGKDVEVYNEFDHTFNNGVCGPTPECYMDMLSVTSDYVKSVDPETTVVGPGNAGMGFKLEWLQKFFDLGGLNYVDAVSAHPYVQPGAPEKLAADLDTIQQMILTANNGESKPIWLTEMGWATKEGWVSDQSQADYLVRVMALSFGHGVERFYSYEAADSSLMDGDIESNFGLFEASTSFVPTAFVPKLAAVGQAQIAQQLQGKKFTVQEDAGENVSSYVFGEKKDATRVIWTTAESSTVTLASKKPVTVTSLDGGSTVVDSVKGMVTLELTGTPVYVAGSINLAAAAG